VISIFRTVFGIWVFHTILLIGTLFLRLLTLLAWNYPHLLNLLLLGFSDNTQDSDSVLDLVFLHPNSSEIDNHHIHPEWRLTSDHAPITVNIWFLKNKFRKRNILYPRIVKKKITSLINYIKNINTKSILNVKALEAIVQSFTSNIDRIWFKHSKIMNITKYSKAWWNHDCHRNLNAYKQSKWVEDWKNFQRTVKKTKYIFFDGKIEEIANKKCRLWELINWVKMSNLLAIKAIQFNGKPCIKLDDLWEALHKLFNAVQNCQVDISLLEDIPDKITTIWAFFQK